MLDSTRLVDRNANIWVERNLISKKKVSYLVEVIFNPCDIR